jgi:hypothetical protein
MTKAELLTLASKAYQQVPPEGDHIDVRDVYDEEMDTFDYQHLDRLGDGLLSFMLVELADTFDPESADMEQLTLAGQMMQIAARQICGVREALHAAQLRIPVEE